MLAVAAVAVLARLPTPWLNLEKAPLAWFDRGTLGPLAFGLRPFIVAALLVEVLAALVPRWRGLRQGEGRARLGARSQQLCFLLAGWQAFFVYRWLDSYHDDAMGPLLPEGQPRAWRSRSDPSPARWRWSGWRGSSAGAA